MANTPASQTPSPESAGLNAILTPILYFLTRSEQHTASYSTTRSP